MEQQANANDESNYSQGLHHHSLPIDTRSVTMSILARTARDSQEQVQYVLKQLNGGEK
jgi:hypothetical protein